MIYYRYSIYLQNGWQGGYGPFMGLFIEMMFYCYMGARISISVSFFFFFFWKTVLLLNGIVLKSWLIIIEFLIRYNVITMLNAEIITFSIGWPASYCYLRYKMVQVWFDISTNDFDAVKWSRKRQRHKAQIYRIVKHGYICCGNLIFS